MPQRSHQAGFTLIELMIAIVIMAMLSLISWRALDSIERTSTQLELKTEEGQRLKRALQQFERDLALRATSELPLPPVPGAIHQLNAPTVELLPPALQARRHREVPVHLEIVRAAPAAPGQWQRVQWWIRGQTLYRAAGPAAAHYPLPPPEETDRVAVLENVQSFAIRAWTPDRGWQRLPTNGQANTAATGLEIDIGLRDAPTPVRTFRRVIALN